MTLRTPFTETFSLRHPIALAPMGGSAGGALAAAVSNGGGLGLVGGGRGDPVWLDRELPVAAAGTGQPWGVGFLSWAVDAGTVERALAYQPRAVMLSFGDPRPFVEPIRRAGAALIIQVTDLDEARQAVDAGADVIVAQGTRRRSPAGLPRGGGPGQPALGAGVGQRGLSTSSLTCERQPISVGELASQAEEALVRVGVR
jgi:nitronate monooxygenase